MYFFDKKTEYLVWKLQEGQVRGVGTVRFSVLDEVCRIEVVVTGCAKVQGTYPVYLLSGDQQSLIENIVLDKGKGALSLRGKTSGLGHQAFPYTQVTGIYIDLKTEGSLEQRWLPVSAGETSSRKEEAGKQKEDMQEERSKIVEREEQVSHKVSSEQPVMESPSEMEQKQPPMSELPSEMEQKKPPEKESFQLYTDKWKQLCAIYPIVHPFGDGRAYLSIEPRDFVVLQEKFQPMVQNSFLLHGFYHYRHLLLGRHKQGRYIQYYLGVPGVFYEKEKSAALFYGFESFEGAVMPATDGTFGYYLKKVQI